MFGGFGIGKSIQAVRAGKKLPRRKVTATEFIEAAIKAGWTKAEATKHSRTAKAFGSYVQVGWELLRLH